MFRLNQKGAALIYAMAAIAATAAIVATTIRMMENSITEERVFLHQMQRNSVARNISSALTNPLFLLQSSSVSFLSFLPGNNALAECLGTGTGSPAYNSGNAGAYSGNTGVTSGTNGPTSGKNGSGQNCVIPSDWDTGTEFLLMPDPSYSFGSSTIAGAQNCASGMAVAWWLQDMSCFIAGHRFGPQVVTYNWSGDTGPAAPTVDFPLTARAFFRPICSRQTRTNGSAPQNACSVAEQIEVRYELAEDTTLAQAAKKTALGPYPQPHEWYTLEVSQIVGSQCNEGAIVTLNEADGQMQCTCYMPYVAQLDANKEPEFNNHGVVCQNTNDMCPAGTIHNQNDQNGNPICEPLNQPTYLWNGDIWWSDAPIGTIHTCNCGGKGGWVNNIDRECVANYQITEHDCHSGCSVNIWEIVGMAIAGFIIGLLVAYVIGWFTGGSSILVYILAAGALSVLGAVVGYILGEQWDWVLIDDNPVPGFSQGHNQTPDIKCQYQLYCAGPDNTGCAVGGSTGGSGAGSGGSNSSSGITSLAAGGSAGGGTTTAPPSTAPQLIMLNNVTYSKLGGTSTQNTSDPAHITLNSIPYSSNCTSTDSTAYASAGMPVNVDFSGITYTNAGGGGSLPATVNVNGTTFVAYCP